MAKGEGAGGILTLGTMPRMQCSSLQDKSEIHPLTSLEIMNVKIKFVPSKPVVCMSHGRCRELLCTATELLFSITGSSL